MHLMVLYLPLAYEEYSELKSRAVKLRKLANRERKELKKAKERKLRHSNEDIGDVNAEGLSDVECGEGARGVGIVMQSVSGLVPQADTTEHYLESCGLSREHQKMARRLFNRYDLDGSGTMNTMIEMSQITTNLLHKLHFSHEIVRLVSKAMKDADHICNADHEMDLSAFMEWFHEAVCHAKGMEVSPDRLPGQQKEKGSAASPPMALGSEPRLCPQPCQACTQVSLSQSGVIQAPHHLRWAPKRRLSVWTPQTLKC